MRRIALLLLAAPLAFASGPSDPGNDPETNLRLLREWRESDSERYARAVRNYERFRALSPETQDRLRQLDRQLNEQDAATRERQMHILSEYAAWLTHLPDNDRQRVLAAATSEERLAIVREVKERQWVEAQPPARVAEWKSAGAEERKRLSERWHDEEQTRQDEWAEVRHWEAMARERPMGARGGDGFRDDVREFVNKRLLPMLSNEERGQLRQAEQMSRFNPNGWMAAVAKLSDKHPVLALEPKFSKRSELPAEYEKVLADAPDTVAARTELKNLSQVDGKWPDYPANVARLARLWKAPVKQQLGPATAKEISPAVEEFVAKKLSDDDRKRLKQDEGKWPEYVQTLHKIARERKLAVPDLDPPGEPQFWDGHRNRPVQSLPDLPQWALERFAKEYNQKNPNNRLSLEKPADREELKRKYFESMRRMPGMGRGWGKPR